MLEKPMPKSIWPIWRVTAYRLPHGIKSMGELRNMLRIFIPGLNFSEREIRNILIRSKNALKKDDSISEMNKKIRQRHLNESDDLGTPLTESDPETYRFLWENDPEWKNYKKFYDHVYGESTDIND